VLFLQKGKTMIRAFSVCVLALGFVTVAWADEKKPNPADYFSIEAAEGACALGKPCTVSVRAVGKNGYKWNVEYPAKIVFGEAPAAVKLSKSVLRQIPNKDNWTDGVKVPLEVSQSGEYALEAQMNLSVCRKDVCRLFRKQAFKVVVRGK